MFKWMLLVYFFAWTANARLPIGHETGNGGDVHLSRYLAAQHLAQVTFGRVTDEKLKTMFTDRKTYQLVKNNLLPWVVTIDNLEFEVKDEMIKEHGQDKAALSVPNSSLVYISKPYFEKYKPTLEEIIVNVIHESGHKLNIKSHDLLDFIGSALVNEIYRYNVNKDAWRVNLRYYGQLKNKMDDRLKKTARQYLERGEAGQLGFFLYHFSRNVLDSGDLAKAFRYMGKVFLDINIKNVEFYPRDYSKFRDQVVHKVLEHYIHVIRKAHKEDAIKYTRYLLAKMASKGLLYTESIFEFNLIADQIYDITMSDKDVVEKLRQYLVRKSFIWLH